LSWLKVISCGWGEKGVPCSCPLCTALGWKWTQLIPALNNVNTCRLNALPPEGAQLSFIEVITDSIVYLLFQITAGRLHTLSSRCITGGKIEIVCVVWTLYVRLCLYAQIPTAAIDIPYHSRTVLQ
jgi:hypothetical protein